MSVDSPAAAQAQQLGLDAALRGEGVLPETVRIAFTPVKDPAAAEACTRALTHSHYENFSVVSTLLPRRLRQDFCNVYAFCRVADDLGDEVPERERALAYLADFRRQLEACYAGKATTAVFVALGETVRRHDIPIKPFDDLIRAFEQDQTVTRYETFAQVVDYCTRSADPVGRIVLYMCGYRDAERQRLSDLTCTALQLINFWQDVRRDMLERDRIYLPAEDMRQFGVTEEQLRAGRVTEGFGKLIKFQVERTEKMFEEGAKLLPLLDKAYRKQIALFGKGGRAICEAVRKQNFDTLTKRPRLSKWQKVRLMLGTLIGGGA
jgi:squalene synthase HpnC